MSGRGAVISYRRTFQGAWVLSAMLGGRRVEMQYMGYTKTGSNLAVPASSRRDRGRVVNYRGHEITRTREGGSYRGGRDTRRHGAVTLWRAVVGGEQVTGYSVEQVRLVIDRHLDESPEQRRTREDHESEVARKLSGDSANRY